MFWIRIQVSGGLDPDLDATFPLGRIRIRVFWWVGSFFFSFFYEELDPVNDIRKSLSAIFVIMRMEESVFEKTRIRIQFFVSQIRIQLSSSGGTESEFYIKNDVFT